MIINSFFYLSDYSKFLYIIYVFYVILIYSVNILILKFLIFKMTSLQVYFSKYSESKGMLQKVNGVSVSSGYVTGMLR